MWGFKYKIVIQYKDQVVVKGKSGMKMGGFSILRTLRFLRLLRLLCTPRSKKKQGLRITHSPRPFRKSFHQETINADSLR